MTNRPNRDAELIDAIIEGDPYAFGDLMEGHQGALLAHCMTILGSLQDAEEAVADTFVELHKKLSDPGKRSTFVPDIPSTGIHRWLMKVATNKALDCIGRRACRFGPVGLSERDSLSGGETVDTNPRVDPEKCAVRSEDRALLIRAAGTLRPKLRTITILVILKNLSSSEAAAILDIRPLTASMQLNRAAEKLQIVIERDEWGDLTFKNGVEPSAGPTPGSPTRTTARRRDHGEMAL